jgi:hypothetical protein
MKFICAICFTLFATTVVSAQNQWGIFAGGQVTSAKYTASGKKQTTSSKPGIQLGAVLKVPFEGSIFFAPEAFYSMKGYKVKFNTFLNPPDVNAVDNNTTIHTFELAALLQIDFGKKPSHFFVKFGPSLDFQLFGKEKFNVTGANAVSRTMKWSPADYGRYAANFLLKAGYETKNGLFILGQYTHSPTSINNADGGPRIFHRAYGLTIGKYLKKK